MIDASNAGASNKEPALVSPIVIFRREIERRGWSIGEAAEHLGVKAPTLYSVTGATPRKISTKLAIRLSAVLGQSLEFWLSDKVPSDSVRTRGGVCGGVNSRSDKSEQFHALNTQQVGVLNDELLDYLLRLEDSPIQVYPFRPESVQPASVDLTAGWFVTKGFDKLVREDWIRLGMHKINPELLDLDERDHVKFLLGEYSISDEHTSECEVALEEVYHLAPGRSVYALSGEVIGVGLDYVARIGQRTQNTLQGLQVLHGFQVDPGYKGTLLTLITNMSDRDITLKRGQPMLSLEFSRLASAATRPYAARIEAKLSSVASSYRKALLDAFTYQRDASGKPIAARLGTNGPSIEGDSVRPFSACVLDWFHEALGDASNVDAKLVSESAFKAMDAVHLTEEAASDLATYLALTPAFEKELRPRFQDGWDLSLLEFANVLGEKKRNIASALIKLGPKLDEKG